MTNNLKFIVEEPQQGRRLDEFLALRMNGVSRMRITRLIAEGGCLVNGEAAESGKKVWTGETIEVLPFEFIPSSMTPQALPLDIAFEDEAVIVVVKPSNMLVHPTVGVKSGTLANALTYHLNRNYFDRNQAISGARTVLEDCSFEAMKAAQDQMAAATEPLVRPGIVHRLDRATSGLLVVAKTDHALSVVARHFRKGLVRKKYLALVRGSVERDEGTIQGPIGRDPGRRPHWWIMESGRHAETRWRVLHRLESATLIELEPVTGRTNQLRIHCAWIGHSILGDELYDERHFGQHFEAPGSSVQDGAVSETQTEARKQAEEGGRCEGWRESHAGPGRLFLHAWRLAFHHPETGEWMQLGSTLPAELLDYLNRFDSDSSERVARSLEIASTEQLVDRQPPEER